MHHPLRICRSLLLMATLLLGGCGATAMPLVSSFRPDVESVGEQLVAGRDCSFHLGGQTFRDLDARIAARHALEDTRHTTLHHVSSRLIYPAPFEVCVEVQGILVEPSSDPQLAAREVPSSSPRLKIGLRVRD